MKNYDLLSFTKTKMVFVLSIVLTLNACQESIEVQKQDDPIELQSQESQKAYAKNHLRVLGQAAIGIAKEPEFREILYPEIEKQFDGDYNVLFETMVNSTIDNVSTGARMAMSLKTEDNFYDALDAFKGIAGTDYYPQIYIPFYEELKEKQTNTNARVLSTDTDPVIVLFSGDDSQDVFPGYKLNDDGELEETDFMVDEEYAMNNEVWVISLNERYFGEEDIAYNRPTNGRTTASPSALVDQIKCKCNKETWAAGDSEVNIITIVSNYRFFELDINLYGNSDNEGGYIYKFSRNDVKNKRNKDVNFYILNDWNDRAPGMPYGHYVIFEYDTWPTGTKVANWEQGGDILSWEYRSADEYYDKQTVINYDFAYHYVNNGCIEWSAQYQ
jgi:hypothetical protein